MRSERIKFKNRDGETLSARLELPVDGRPHAMAIFAHCFTCNKNLNAVRNISRSLALSGIGVLRFDFTGLGQSEGDFSETDFSHNVDDIVSASEYLREAYMPPSVLVGHSLGGAAVVFAAAQMDSVRAVVTIGAPSDPVHVSKLLGDKEKELESLGEAEVNIGGRPFKIKKQFMDDLRTKDMPAILNSLRKAILVAHSPQDTVVGIENAAAIYSNSHHPKSFISLDGADHLLSAEADSKYLGQLIASWVSRYVVPAKEEALDSDAMVMARLDEAGFTTKMKVGDHRMLADEPISMGGRNSGPAPYEFVCAGLAACTVMTIRMYTDRKEWPLDSVDVHVDHEKIDDESGPRGKRDKFIRHIDISGDLDDAQKQRIMQIADKCPVHRTLESESIISTVLLSQ